MNVVTENFEKEMIAWRHDFHAHPELNFDLDITSAKVAEILKSFGLEVVDLKNIKTLADTCTGGYMKIGIYRHRTIGYWNSDWESLQDQTVYLDSIVIRKPKKEEKFKK